MTQEERYGTRSGTYSAWHRRKSTQRFIGIENAQLLAMVDIDVSLWLEYEENTKEPLAIIETAKDVGQKYKTTTVARNLAIRAHLPCYTVLFTESEKRNPADHNYFDIEEFRIKELWPNRENGWTILKPKKWAEKLLEIRYESAKNIDNLLYLS